MTYSIKLSVNGRLHEAEVSPLDTLLGVLRSQLGLTGTKLGCETGDCGACTVLVDGVPVTSCLVLAVGAEGRDITTVEGLAEDTRLHPLQQAFVDAGAVQCGYCTPGMLMSARALLDTNLDPTEEDIRTALSGNICRCTGYDKIIDGVLAGAQAAREGGAS